MDFFQWNDHDENTQHTCYFDFTAASCMSGMPAAHSQRADPMVLFVEITTVAYIDRMSKKRKIITTLSIYVRR
jgi:hypothetical protein